MSQCAVDHDQSDQCIVNSSITLTDLTFGRCDHVMVDLLSSALKTLQQAHLLAGVFPTKVAHMSIVV